MPVDFDRRTFTFFPNKIRLTTIKGRIDIPIEIPEYYKKYLNWKYQTCKLFYDKKQDKLFLHITFSREIDFIQTKNPKITGIDLGINNIAVTSDMKFFNSSKIKNTKIKFKYIRSRLQSKGTKSSKKLLKKISGREKRFMRQSNHEISKQIVSSVNPGDTIVMERLRGIRKSKVRKKQRYWLNNWSFYQLQKFIEYKAVRFGAKVIYVNPRNTSKTCSRCHSINSIRKGSDFHCLNCSYHLNADLNASYNLKFLGMFLITKADVNQPYIPSVDCEAILRN
jgi:IS605 OrfB family transposase